MTEDARPPRRRLRARALAAGGGLALGLLAAEVGLRVYSFLEVRAATARIEHQNLDGRPVVAFVGDSNVYGLYVDKESTLPKCVERLSQRGGARGVQCVNFGQPGAPTWVVLEQARRALKLRPVAVVVRAGANDGWQVPPEEGLAWLEDLRLVRVARFASFGWANRDAVGNGGRVLARHAPRDGAANPFEIEETSASQTPAEVEGRILRGLDAIAQRVAAGGSRCVMATYLWSCEALPRKVRTQMLAVQMLRDVPVSDCSEAFLLATRDKSAEEAVERQSRLLTRDRHPTALGYEVEARVVARTLREMGVLPDVEPGAPLDPLNAVPIEIPSLKQIAGSALAFETRGRPGDRVTLLLGGPGVSRLKGLPLALNFEPLRVVFGKDYHESLRSTADGAGKARIEVPATARPLLAAPMRAVCVVARGGMHGDEQVLMTPTIDVELAR